MCVRNTTKNTCFKLSGFLISVHFIRCLLNESDRETADFFHVRDVITPLYYSHVLVVGSTVNLSSDI